MMDYFVHESAYIDEECKIGKGTKIWHFSHVLSGSEIGKQCNIGQNVVIGPDVIIGNQCKIQNNVSIYKGVTLEDGVFCGPSMVFTNIYNPRAEIRKMDQVRPTLVKKGATIGANSTIICGLTLGSGSFVSTTLQQSERILEKKYKPKRTIDDQIAVADKVGISPELICSRSRQRKPSEARAIFPTWLLRKQGTRQPMWQGFWVLNE